MPSRYGETTPNLTNCYNESIMKFASLDARTYALRFDPGDDILAELTGFCTRQTITNASIAGLGSIENPTLAHYSIHTKQFTTRELPGVFEITTLAGNVALVDGQPAVHVHVAIADDQMRGFGGHLMAGACSATLELILTAYPSRLSKSHSDAIGLNVWDF